MRTLNLLHSRRGRLSAFCLLYVSEGIPYGFSSTAMVAFMRMEGLSVEQIGAMALAYALLGTLQVDHGFDATQLSQLAVAGSIVAATGCVLGGVLGDKFGIKRVVAAGYVLTTLPTLFLAYQISAVGLTNIPVQLFIVALCVMPFLEDRQPDKAVAAEPA